MTQEEIASEPWASLAWDLPDRLRKALRVSGVSVQEMAESLGVERNTVGRYINGHTKPNRATLVAWAVRSGIPVEYLEHGVMPAADAERPAAPGGGRAFVAEDGAAVRLERFELPTFWTVARENVVPLRRTRPVASPVPTPIRRARHLQAVTTLAAS